MGPYIDDYKNYYNIPCYVYIAVTSCSLAGCVLVTHPESPIQLYALKHLVGCCHGFAMCCHGLPCVAMVCHVLPWFAMCCHGLPCVAMVCHAACFYIYLLCYEVCIICFYQVTRCTIFIAMCSYSYILCYLYNILFLLLYVYSTKLLLLYFVVWPAFYFTITIGTTFRELLLKLHNTWLLKSTVATQHLSSELFSVDDVILKCFGVLQSYFCCTFAFSMLLIQFTWLNLSSIIENSLCFHLSRRFSFISIFLNCHALSICNVLYIPYITRSFFTYN